jgi:hypothetical protein
VKLTARLGRLEERPFRLLWIGRSTSQFGDAVSGIALAFAVLELASATALGVVFAAFTLSRTVLWREVRSRRWVQAAFASFAIGNMTIAVFFVLAPQVFADELGGARDWGLAMSPGPLSDAVGRDTTLIAAAAAAVVAYLGPLALHDVRAIERLDVTETA